MDLFEHYENLPENVKTIIDKYNDADNDYQNCNNLIEELEAVGYTCEYSLDAVPHNLKKII